MLAPTVKAIGDLAHADTGLRQPHPSVDVYGPTWEVAVAPQDVSQDTSRVDAGLVQARDLHEAAGEDVLGRDERILPVHVAGHASRDGAEDLHAGASRLPAVPAVHFQGAQQPPDAVGRAPVVGVHERDQGRGRCLEAEILSGPLAATPGEEEPQGVACATQAAGNLLRAWRAVDVLPRPRLLAHKPRARGGRRCPPRCLAVQRDGVLRQHRRTAANA
mmetsp:Transcript_41853/g.130273  ORF Transcript_41853/g.130273 Transcript_41853/m.130273 type:complete len:218 (-) Transcript_41853:13-666(-)